MTKSHNGKFFQIFFNFFSTNFEIELVPKELSAGYLCFMEFYEKNFSKIIKTPFIQRHGVTGFAFFSEIFFVFPLAPCYNNTTLEKAVTAMNILIIDGQGGGIGRQLVEQIKHEFPQALITGVGTNALAAQAMLKAGAHRSATGENAVVVACRTADIIIGPIGIAIADSLWGEITPTMALAVGQSSAARILLPMNLCNNYIAGVGRAPTSLLIRDCLDKIRSVLDDKG